LICKYFFFQEFEGNVDNSGLKRNNLNPPLEAQIVRLQPTEFEEWMSLGWELYGVKAN